jgi:hypothetical protein
MKFKRRFYDSTVSFRNISKERLILGIVIGLASVFFIYGFLYMLRELFRVLSNGFGYLPNILSEFERNTFNWFFAALSLVFGNSIVINFVIGRSQNVLPRRNPKRFRILNEQLFLNANFFYWFAKMGSIIGLISINFTDFNFLPNFIIPIILLILVLYLESWKTLSLILRKKRFKWMTIHFLIFFVFSFGLSKVNFINYKTIDNEQLKYNPLIDLPKSNYDNVTYMDPYMNVYLSDNNNGKLLFKNYENDITDSNLDFLDYKLRINWRFQEKASIRILVNSNTKMDVVKIIEQQIKKANINYIIYGTFENDLIARRFSSGGIKIKLADTFYYEDDILKAFYTRDTHFYEVEKDFKPKDTLNIKLGKEVKIDNLVVPNDMLVIKFTSYINENTIFQYEYSLDLNYQNYITVLSSHLFAIKKLREKNITVTPKWENFKLKNRKEFIEDQQRLRDEFPFRIIEKIN